MLVLCKAIQLTVIVHSLFPENVWDQLVKTSNNNMDSNNSEQDLLSMGWSSFPMKNYLMSSIKVNNNGNNNNNDDEPIANLFPHCTVFFADITSFMAWSSSHNPTQLFILLQMLYCAFDKIAKKQKVFKVETIGDSYVAVTSLPEAQPNHAVIMAW